MLILKRSITFSLFLLIFNILCAPILVSQESTDSLPKYSQYDNPYEGMWLREMDSIVLYIVDYKVDSFGFVMVNYLCNYFGFLGGSDGDFYKYARINNDIAYFNDSGAYVDGRPLYYEGEEPCELNFSLVGSEMDS